MASSIRSATKRALSVALVLTLGLGPLVAQAADTPAESQAKALFQSGSKAYDVGDFEGALKFYTDAYQLAPRAGFLFNIAQCHRQLSNFERAAFFYQRFIDQSKPKAPNTDVAAQLLEEMKSKQAEKVAADKAKADDDAKKAEQARLAEEARQAELKKLDAPLATALTPSSSDNMPPPPPPPVVEDPAYKKAWFWVLIVGGAAAIAGGVTAGVVLSQPGPKSTTLMPIGSH
jgi:tetratricopeptide (TPR) repeat protein